MATNSGSHILTDDDALVQIKEPSRKLYAIAFNQLREYLGKDLEIEPPSEKELLDYFKYLRLEKNMASSSLWTTYSKINGICKAKYSFNLKQYYRVTSLIKSFDINKFLEDREISSPFWLVRKACVSVAFYGGLRLSEVMNLKIEKFQSTAEGIYVTHMRSKQRSDKQDSR